MSCGKDVAPGDAKLFAQIFVCPSCYVIAERLMQRGERDLKMMLTLLKESVRLVIMKHELQFLEAKIEDEVKTDLVTELARLAEEARRAQRDPSWQPTTHTETRSRETTSLPALTQGAVGKPTSG